MFEKLKELIKGVLRKVFNRDELKNKIEVDIAVSDAMANNIDLWTKLYKNNAPWLCDTVQSLNLSATIAAELARLTTIELETSVDDPTLDAEYQVIVDELRQYCEQGCATGGLAFKPYFDNDTIVIDIVPADSFYPTAFNSKGRITGAVFVDRITKGKVIYTKLEYHSLVSDVYTIKNMVFENKTLYSDIGTLEINLGDQIPLSNVSEWADLEDEVTIQNVDSPLFSYFKMPGVNLVDRNSPLGFSCFGKAVDLIKEADKQYSRILWEYEGSELAVDADANMFKKDYNGNVILPKGKERLFRTFNIQATDTATDKLNVFSPTIRDSSLFNGLDNLLKRIEFNCGLSYGTISDPSTVDKTATEVINSKQRLYSTVKDIQKSLQTALEGLVYAMGIWCSLKGLTIKLDAEMEFNWDDSIIVDKHAELLAMQQDVASGILKPEVYLAKKYGVTEEEALKMLPKASSTVQNNPFGNDPGTE